MRVWKPVRKMFGQILAKRVVTLEFTRMMGQDGRLAVGFLVTFAK